MSTRNVNAYQTRIQQIAFGLLFIAVVAVVVRSLMFGAYGTARLVIYGIVFLGLLFVLDRHYVLLCPLLSIYPFKVPGLPFNGAEFGALSFLAVWFVRKAARKESVAPFSPIIWLAVPYFLWVARAYLVNPVGLAMFGAESIGARAYFDIALGFAVLLVYSRQFVTEKQCKALFVSMFLFSLAQIAINYYQNYSRPGASMLFGRAAQQYYLDSAVFATLLLLCRFRVSAFLQRPGLLCAALALIGLVVFSGRRTYMGYVVLAPFFLMVLRGREKMMTLVCAGIAAMLLAFVIVGQGRAYELPLSVQRALSPFPGRWDSRFDRLGTEDPFREEMKQIAREKIAASPWFGEGGIKMDYDEMIWMHANSLLKTQGESGMVVSRNWHNKFWGMSADFGLPAGVFWYLFAISVTGFIWKSRFQMRTDDCRSSLALYYSLLLCYDLVFTMGGSASTPLLRWPQFAFLLAVLNQPVVVQSVPAIIPDRKGVAFST